MIHVFSNILSFLFPSSFPLFLIHLSPLSSRSFSCFSHFPPHNTFILLSSLLEAPLNSVCGPMWGYDPRLRNLGCNWCEVCGRMWIGPMPEAGLFLKAWSTWGFCSLWVEQERSPKTETPWIPSGAINNIFNFPYSLIFKISPKKMFLFTKSKKMCLTYFSCTMMLGMP